MLGKRTIKTDVIDLQAMTELLLAGRGLPVAATGRWCWASSPPGRRIGPVGSLLRTATKNQLLGQLDRTFPGLTLALPDVLATKVGRLVAAEFADPPGSPPWAAAGSSGSVPPAACRSASPSPTGSSQAARDALPTAGRRGRPRGALAADLALLADLDAQVDQRHRRSWPGCCPRSPFAPLLTVPGLGCGPRRQLRRRAG